MKLNTKQCPHCKYSFPKTEQFYQTTSQNRVYKVCLTCRQKEKSKPIPGQQKLF